MLTVDTFFEWAPSEIPLPPWPQGDLASYFGGQGENKNRSSAAATSSRKHPRSQEQENIEPPVRHKKKRRTAYEQAQAATLQGNVFYAGTTAPLISASCGSVEDDDWSRKQSVEKIIVLQQLRLVIMQPGGDALVVANDAMRILRAVGNGGACPAANNALQKLCPATERVKFCLPTSTRRLIGLTRLGFDRVLKNARTKHDLLLHHDRPSPFVGLEKLEQLRKELTQL